MKKTLLSLLILGVAALTVAQVTPTGRITKTFPPSGATTGSVGGSGPLPNEQLPSSLLTGLLSYYKMDETTGTRVDSKGGNDLAESGGATGFTAAGKLGNAASFVVARYLVSTYNVAFVAGLAGNGATWSFWAFRSSIPSNTLAIMGENNAGLKQFDFRIKLATGSANFIMRDSTGAPVNVDSGAHTGVWRHFVWTYTTSDKKGRLYVDGALEATTAGALTTNALWNASTGFIVGKSTGGGLDFAIDGGTAYLDEFAVFDRTITTGEIGCLYGGGTPPAYPFTGVC